MEQRKRPTRTISSGGNPSDRNASTITSPQFNRTRVAKGGRIGNKRGISLFPFGFVIIATILGAYLFVYQRLLSHINSSTKTENGDPYERTFHDNATPRRALTAIHGPVTKDYLPTRPRVMGYYFANSDSSSFIGTERMDPNLYRIYGSVAFPDGDIFDHKKLMALRNSDEYRSGRADNFEVGDCVAQYEWQKKSFPSCNLLLEQDMTNLALDRQKKDVVKLIANGYWRDVWRVRNPLDTVVVKTIRYEHEYEERNYDRHRRDAVAMERLTSSEYVMNIYGYCGNSGIFEFADGGSIENSIFSRHKDEDEWTAEERLVVAYQIASGLAELHNFAKEGVPAIAHTDITPSQFVYVGDSGLYKLNDFNRCRFIRWDVAKNTTCTYHVGNNPGTFRSPEEYAYQPQTEKIDIYSMGNIFYSIATGAWPFQKEKKSKVGRNKIMNGERPDMTNSKLDENNPFDQTFLKIIEMCWEQDPIKRATAREVQLTIEETLQRMGVKQG